MRSAPSQSSSLKTRVPTAPVVRRKSPDSWRTYEQHWLKERVRWMDLTKKDEGARRALVEICKESNEAFFNLLVWTLDPRASSKDRDPNRPMILYPFQIETLERVEAALKGSRDVLIEKSRDMGATWLLVGHSVRHWLWTPGYNCLFGSRREAAVDNYTPDSIFGKHDYMLRRFPEWIVPQQYFSGQRNRTKLIIRNPQNGNVIAGESTNENFSRSGRYTEVIMDEFAFWDVDRLAWKATADSSPTRIPVSTPNPENPYSKFARLRFAKDDEPPIEVVTLHWTCHPEKDQAWYDNEKKRRTAEEIAVEIDIQYERNVRDRVYADFDRHKTATETIDYDPELDLWISWDFGIATTGLLWIQAGPGHDYRVIDEYEAKNADIDHFIQVIADKQDVAGYGREMKFVGDLAGSSRSQIGGLSVVDRIFHSTGINVFLPPKGLCTYENRIRKTALVLKHTRVSKTCTRFIECLENYKFRTQVRSTTNRIGKPVMNWASHLVTAFEYFSLIMPEPGLGDLSIEIKKPQDEAQLRFERAFGIGRFRQHGMETVILDPRKEAWS